MEKLICKFHCIGEIVVDNSNIIADPIDISLRLYLLNSGKRKFIGNIHTLENKVWINSNEAALNFVRLTTSPKTFHMMLLAKGEKRKLEVVDYNNITPDLFFGDVKMLKDAKKFYNGYLGVFKKCEYSVLPEVIKRDKYFIVTRNILQKDGRFIENIYKMKEKIHFNGKYQILSKNIILKDVKINAFPIYQ